MKRILLLLVALALIALIVWFERRDRAEPTAVERGGAAEAADRRGEKQLEREAPEPSSSADDARSQVATDAPSQSESSSMRLHVRSSARLALAYVEFEVEDRLWHRRGLVDETCSIEGLLLPRRVRAPGHLAALAKRVEDDVVLEPDALLVLDGDGLRECLPFITPFEGKVQSGVPGGEEWAARISSMLVSGFVDDNHWLMATSFARIDEEFTFEDHVDIHLEWADHRVGYVEFLAHPGARGQWTLPCGSIENLAELDVDLVLPTGVPRGAVEATITRRDDTREKPFVRKETWGQIQIDPASSIFDKTTIGSGQVDVHFYNIPRGASYLVRARDLESGAFGCKVIEHDGSRQSLALHEGIVIHGRFSSPAGSPSMKGNCFWRSIDAPGEDVSWTGHRSDCYIGDDGEFELRGWENLPSKAEQCSEFPSKLELTMQLIGFENVIRTFPVDDAGHCDCGEIKLVPHVPQFVLAPGHRVPETLDDLAVRISTHPEWSLSIVHGVALADDAFALYPDVQPDDVRSPPVFWGWDEHSDGVPKSVLEGETIQALIVDLFNSEGCAFRRAADGRYERVPERTYQIEIDCSALPSEGKVWTIGWNWLGMPQRVSSISAGAVGERKQIEFTAPESGVSLWWSSSEVARGYWGEPKREAGEIELGPTPVTVKVP